MNDRYSDTIAAISTAPGLGAIGILRVSGPATLSLSAQFLLLGGKPIPLPTLESFHKKQIFCDFSHSGILLDKIVFLFSKGPNSFTGEDLAEFHFHGNPILLRQALELFFQSGARPANPGEFTKRAFLNKKIDLTEAESIGRLIHSRSRFELELSQKNLFGEISKLASKIRSEVLGIKAELEAEIDFSTEDLTYESLEERKSRLRKLNLFCEDIILRSNRADRLIHRSKVVLFGEPNVGKSSLMNQILGKERSIISEVPGTTRDYISEDYSIAGIPIQLIDTAGIRDTTDQIEKLGIQQSLREAESADIKLIIFDLSRPMKFGISYWDSIQSKVRERGKLVLVCNKKDQMDSSWDLEKFRESIGSESEVSILSISCKTGEGVSDCIQIIQEFLTGSESSEEYVILEDRQRFHFQKAAEALLSAESLLNAQAPAEIVIKEVDEAVFQIGQVTGSITTEEVLGRIFSVFCVGK